MRDVLQAVEGHMWPYDLGKIQFSSTQNQKGKKPQKKPMSSLHFWSFIKQKIQ